MEKILILINFCKIRFNSCNYSGKSTGEVLMLAYMNKESMKKTFETGYTWFWSRSRQELWNKGATSGHLQKVIEIFGDCDDDTLLITVEQTGAACHTGNHSCFYTQLK